jgi:hypothetical protein
MDEKIEAGQVSAMTGKKNGKGRFDTWKKRFRFGT